MSYNLINSTTLAMMEGEPRTTVSVVPLQPADNPYVYEANSGNTNVDVMFDKPFNVSDFWAFDISIYIAGITKGANYTSNDWIARAFLLGDDGIAATDVLHSFRQTGPIAAITDAAFKCVDYRIRLAPTTGNSGTMRIDGYRFYLGDGADVHDYGVASNVFPASGKIGGVRLQLKTDYDVQTCGVMFSVGGIQ